MHLSSLLLTIIPALIAAAPMPSLSILERREIFGDEADDIVNEAACKPVTVVFARGTLEIGNLGLLVGPPFLDALSVKLGDGKMNVQGVPYPATIPGYLEGGSPSGSQEMADLTAQAVAKCPKTQIVLSGYSQGAQLVHNSVNLMKPEVAAKISAVVMFGDPFDGRPIPNVPAASVDTFCFSWDLICKDTIIVDAAHLAYAIDATPAAEFVAGKVQV